MNIDAALLAEGATGDIRGAITLVGYNQRVVNAPTLPFSFKLTLVVSLSGETEKASQAQISVNLESPEGESAFAFSQPVQLPASTVKGVPSFTNIAMDIPFTGVSYGVYRLTASWREAGQEAQDREIEVFVVNPAEASAPSA
ncbi:DUF6941 family protein [Streptomyces pseudovenezuelae]|uniref:DUF6941 family protein n=1 Tax=Streptomyces pseudovenezuelae TaxID=67350 RepID=UPI0036F018B8